MGGGWRGGGRLDGRVVSSIFAQTIDWPIMSYDINNLDRDVK